jgi:hypothetical protein
MFSIHANECEVSSVHKVLVRVHLQQRLPDMGASCLRAARADWEGRMTRRYGEMILVAQHTGNNHPRCFIWRGSTYRVVAVLATWHLRDRWWKPASQGYDDAPGPAVDQESDRHYYRLDCSPGLLCDLYFDAASDRWILDRVYD